MRPGEERAEGSGVLAGAGRSPAQPDAKASAINVGLMPSDVTRNDDIVLLPGIPRPLLTKLAWPAARLQDGRIKGVRFARTPTVQLARLRTRGVLAGVSRRGSPCQVLARLGDRNRGRKHAPDCPQGKRLWLGYGSPHPSHLHMLLGPGFVSPVPKWKKSNGWRAGDRSGWGAAFLRPPLMESRGRWPYISSPSSIFCPNFPPPSPENP
jgi:hypothetical protein